MAAWVPTGAPMVTTLLLEPPRFPRVSPLGLSFIKAPKKLLADNNIVFYVYVLGQEELAEPETYYGYCAKLIR